MLHQGGTFCIKLGNTLKTIAIDVDVVELSTAMEYNKNDNNNKNDFIYCGLHIWQLISIFNKVHRDFPDAGFLRPWRNFVAWDPHFCITVHPWDPKQLEHFSFCYYCTKSCGALSNLHLLFYLFINLILTNNELEMHYCIVKGPPKFLRDSLNINFKGPATLVWKILGKTLNSRVNYSRQPVTNNSLIFNNIVSITQI